MSDPFIEATKAVPSQADQDQENALPDAQAFAAERSPERSAQLLKKARAAGMSLELVEAETGKAPAVDWREMTRGLPATQETLSDPERAAAMQDDVPALVAIERFFLKGWTETAWETKKAWERGRINQRVAEIGYRQSQGTATPEEIAEADRLERLGALIPRPPLGWAPRAVRAAVESVPLMLSSFEGSADLIGTWAVTGALAGATVGGVATAPAGGVGAVPGAITGLVGGARWGQKIAMMREVGKQEQGLAYREYIQMPGVALARSEPTSPAAEPGVLELAIERADLLLRECDRVGDEGVVLLADLLQRMKEAWSRGVRALLLSLDSTGGHAQAGRVLYHALRCWSEQGGRSVAYIDCRALSTASLVAVGTDYAVMNPQAIIGIHGSILRDPLGGAEEAAYLERVRHLDGAAYQARTLLPPETLAAFQARQGSLEKPSGVVFGHAFATAHGFVDCVGGRGKARKLARRLARGKSVTSPRQHELAKRTVAPQVAVLVEQLRAEARGFLRAMSTDQASAQEGGPHGEAP